MSTLFGRKASLVVSAGNSGLDLSQFRFRFHVSQMDVETPNTLSVRVYNLKPETVNQIQGEYSHVTLQAGYDPNFAVIFDGTIKQFHKGKESNVDSYLDILAAEGDIAYNFGLINKTLSANSSAQDRADALSSAMDTQMSSGADAFLQGGILPRGKTMFGLARFYFRSLAASQKVRWSIQNGKVTLTPLTGYLEGEAIRLSSQTGMIGIPEATDNGIIIRTLLNPRYSIGNRVQINNAEINQIIVREQGFPQYNSLSFPASTSDDGFYRVLVIEHSGDTRGHGNDWISELTCVALDSPAGPVKAYG